MISMAELAVQMHANIDLTNEEEIQEYLHGFGRSGENFIGVRRRPARSIESAHLEIGPNGIVQPARKEFGLYITYGGTPHHSRHVFGYWHINDVDEIVFTIPGKTPDDDATNILLMRAPKPGEQELFAWYCLACATLLHAVVFDSGNLNGGFPALARAESHAVRTFNSEPALRVCQCCGTEHPLAYRFWPAANTPEEEAARALW